MSRWTRKNPYGEIYVYVPEYDELLHIAKGSGEDLCDEDIEQEVVSYIYFDVVEFERGLAIYDSDMVQLAVPFEELYENTEECIEDVLCHRYGKMWSMYVVLCRSTYTILKREHCCDRNF